MEDGIRIALVLIGLPISYFWALTIAFFVLTPAYIMWEARVLRLRIGRWPKVSVLVPAYNEERTIALTLRSILGSDYETFEVIVVNDGSVDGTEQEVAPFLTDARLRYLAKPNGGKASALNHGLATATGDVIVFTDADSIFTPSTIRDGVRYLADARVGAMGGNDSPLKPRGPLQKMLVLTSHIGTGFVRRALSVVNLLPIIPGNLGFVRAEILRDIGGFREVWGEDLELTLRLHRHGVRVVYGARTKVFAECPHSMAGLWKQRVRWIRSFFKVVVLHRDMLWARQQRLFAVFMALTTLNLLLVPAAQLIALVLIPVALGMGVITLGWLEMIGYLGLFSVFACAIYAALLDRQPGNLRYLAYLLLMVPISFFYNAVVLYSIWAELRSRPERWNKLDRLGETEMPGMAFDAQRRRVLASTVAIAGTGAGAVLARGQISRGERAALRRKLVDARLSVAVHFSDWPDWKQAVAAIPTGDVAQVIDDVAISAGRVDWTYFRWPGHEHWWSGPQSQIETDMLARAVDAVQARGKRAIAVLDVFGSRYLRGHPEVAAVDVRGNRSSVMICSTALVEGDYGDLLVDAAAALCRQSEAAGLCLTELFYDDTCYDTRCLDSFRRFSGRPDWPRDRGGRIDRLDPAIGSWRSHQVAAIVARIAYAARAERKQFLFDVRVSRDRLHRNSAENGQDYALLLPLVDQLVVWDYFALEGVKPQSSRQLARYLTTALGADRYWHSIGLWDRGNQSLEAAPMMQGVLAALSGGARNIWITPGRKLGPRHWQALAEMAAV